MKQRTLLMVGIVSFVLSAPSFAALSTMKNSASDTLTSVSIVKDVEKGARVVRRGVVRTPRAVVRRPVARAAVVATPVVVAPSAAVVTPVIVAPSAVVVTPRAVVVTPRLATPRVRVVR